MSRARRLAASCFPAAIALLVLAGTARAQYMYMDANGDGIWTTADYLQSNGTPTTVDVWVNTNHNRDGSPAACNTADGNLGTWNSYAVNLAVSGGTVTFGEFVSRQSGFDLTCVGVGVDFLSNGTEMTACRATASPGAAGLRRMFTVTITGQTGTPSVDFVPSGTLCANSTSFGTPCSGNDFDNTYKLGSDFFDNDGLRVIVEGSTSPVISAPATVNGPTNALVSVAATASDPDAGQLVTLSQTNDAAFLSGPASAGPSPSPATITLSGSPSASQFGRFTILWSATDNAGGAASAGTTLFIRPPDRAPVVTAPLAVMGMESTPLTFLVGVTDPDGDAIAGLTASGSAIGAGATFTPNATNRGGTFAWTPSLAQAGAYYVVFTASNALSGSALTSIVIQEYSTPLTIQAPSAVSALENVALEFTVTASDPDGDPIAILSAGGSAMTAGGTFSVGVGNTSGTFRWTPGSAQAGIYSVVFFASNSLPLLAQNMVTAGTVVTVLAPETGINLVGNPSFESSTAGWGGLDGGTIARVAGGFEGDWALEVRGPSTGTGKFSVNDSPNWVVASPGAGAVYRFTAWVRSDAAAGLARLRIREYTGRVYRATTYSSNVRLGTTWQKLVLDCAVLGAGSTLDFQVMDAPVGPGEVFQTDAISIVLQSSGSALRIEPAIQARMSPNPLNPEATLTFTTERSGPVRVRVFSPSGRLVRTLLEDGALPAARHAIRFDGKDGDGRRLASGIYFYRIEGSGAAATGRFAIVQ